MVSDHVSAPTVLLWSSAQVHHCMITLSGITEALTIASKFHLIKTNCPLCRGAYQISRSDLLPQ